LTSIVAHAILFLETTMLSEMQESDPERVPESELPTEPRLGAISPTSLAAESVCVAVQEPLATPFVPPVVFAQQLDSLSLQSHGSRAESGMMYTLSSPDELLQRLEEVARIQHCCVSLLVHDAHGWHELFFKRRGALTHIIAASYVRDIVANNDLDLWMNRKSAYADGDDKQEMGEIDGYQLVVNSLSRPLDI
jgi:hypothetical protein